MACRCLVQPSAGPRVRVPGEDSNSMNALTLADSRSRIKRGLSLLFQQILRGLLRRASPTSPMPQMKGNAMERLFMSVNETCDMLGISRTTIYRLISTGRLETVRIGRRRLVRLSSIEELASHGSGT